MSLIKKKITFNASFSYTIFNSRWVYVVCEYATNKTDLENTRQSLNSPDWIERLTNADPGLTFPGAQHPHFWLSLTPCRPQEMLILYLATDQLIAWSFTSLQNAYKFISSSLLHRNIVLFDWSHGIINSMIVFSARLTASRRPILIRHLSLT